MSAVLPPSSAPWRIEPFAPADWAALAGGSLIGMVDPLSHNADVLRIYAGHEALTLKIDGLPVAVAVLVELWATPRGPALQLMSFTRPGIGWRAAFAGAQAMMDLARAKGAARVQAECRRDYPASARLARLLGFQRDGRLPCFDQDGRDYDLYAWLSADPRGRRDDVLAPPPHPPSGHLLPPAGEGTSSERAA